MRNTQSICLASRTEEENHILRRKLEPLAHEYGPVQFVSTRPAGLAASIDAQTTQVILNYNEWQSKDAMVVEDLRGAAAYKGPILLIAKTQLVEAIRDLRSIEQVCFLEKPFETKDLQGIVRKYMNERAVAQRIHRRYNIMQEAEVEFQGRADKKFSRLFNLSKGGAYMEFLTLVPVKVGEILRLKMELRDVNRTYTMPAKVVWMMKSTSNGCTGCGVEFLGRGDVQRVIIGSY